MRTVGIKVLKNKLSEYIRLVATTGETVLVTDRDRVVAELNPPGTRQSVTGDPVLDNLVRRGLLIPATKTGTPPPTGLGIMSLEELLKGLDEDRADRV
ncbi:MAG: type II toxin-antitoxin system Phd/YefM family antitoxin [Gemmatimonadales bacterium]